MWCHAWLKVAHSIILGSQYVAKASQSLGQKTFCEPRSHQLVYAWHSWKCMHQRCGQNIMSVCSREDKNLDQVAVSPVRLCILAFSLVFAQVCRGLMTDPSNTDLSWGGVVRSFLPVCVPVSGWYCWSCLVERWLSLPADPLASQSTMYNDRETHGGRES